VPRGRVHGAVLRELAQHQRRRRVTRPAPDDLHPHPHRGRPMATSTTTATRTSTRTKASRKAARPSVLRNIYLACPRCQRLDARVCVLLGSIGRGDDGEVFCCGDCGVGFTRAEAKECVRGLAAAAGQWEAVLAWLAAAPVVELAGHDDLDDDE